MTQEIYSIRVQGHLDQERSSWFDGLAITHTTNGETILSGSIVDQAALHGVLLKIRDLGLSLLEVKRGSLALDDGRASAGDEAGAPLGRNHSGFCRRCISCQHFWPIGWMGSVAPKR